MAPVPTLLRPRRLFRYALLLWLLYSLHHTYQVHQRQRIDPTSEWGRYAKRPGARGRALMALIVLQVGPLYALARLGLAPHRLDRAM